MTAACGVTPQAQNTGTSPAATATGSPKSGASRSVMPSAAGSPTCTGAPCTAGYREVIRRVAHQARAGSGASTPRAGRQRARRAAPLVVRYIGTLDPASMWRTGTPAASSARSKVKLQPSRKPPGRRASARASVTPRRARRAVHAVRGQVGAQVAREERRRTPRRLSTSSTGQGSGCAGRTAARPTRARGTAIRFAWVHPAHQPAVGARSPSRNSARASPGRRARRSRRGHASSASPGTGPPPVSDSVAEEHRDQPRDAADHQQPQRVAVAVDQVPAPPGDPQQHPEADRQDQPVERTGEHQQVHRLGADHQEHRGETTMKPTTIQRFHRATQWPTLHERRRRVRRTDHRRDRRAPDHHAEHDPADLTERVVEDDAVGLSGRLSACRDDPEHRQEQHDPHQRGDEMPENRAPADLARPSRRRACRSRGAGAPRRR